jgi:putative ABC transport system permease protein
MFLLVLRKLTRNKWLVLCILGGAVLAIALVASVPLYTDGILQRMLTRDLEQEQEGSGVFAGRYTVSASYYDPLVPFQPAFTGQDRHVQGELFTTLGLPVLARTSRLTLDSLQVAPVPAREAVPKERLVRLDAAEGAADHLKITRGRLFSPDAAGGVIEVVVTAQALADMDLRMDETYEAKTLQQLDHSPLRLRVVGIYEPRDSRDLWWYRPLWQEADGMLADYGLVRRLFADPQSRLLTSATWSSALDYHAITLATLAPLVATLQEQVRFYQSSDVSYALPMLDVLRAYALREGQLLRTLWFLQIPVLAMLAFYLCMVSLLIVNAERNEIAILKSRGAGSAQIFLIYMGESLLIALIACAAGPPLGLLVCKAIGGSSGFLEFVRRAPLSIPLSPRSFLAGAAAGVLLLAALTIPAIAASRTTIVQHKLARARGRKAPAWKRFFIDLALLCVAGYGFFTYRLRPPTTGAADATPLDPLLLLVSTCFILGVGLLFLRLHPFLVRFLFRIGRKIWPPVLYAPLLHVGRSAGSEQFLMLFLILTLATGILDARFDRTINRNVQERIQYAAGADITLQEAWPSSGGEASTPGSITPAAGTGTPGEPIVYFEPDFSRYKSLPGAETLTRVLRRAGALVDGPDKRAIKSSFMAVSPAEFGDVAWFRPGLLPTHWNNYLNLLAAHANAFLVSESFARTHGIRLGDTLYVTWAGQGYLDGVVYAFVPYWPTYNPRDPATGEPAQLVVANLSYVQAKMRGEPYEVWIKKAPAAESAVLYAALRDRQIPIEHLSDTTPLLIAAKSDAMLQGINGAFTMAFAAAMAVCLSGSLISWILSFQARTLQFGIFRAMGLRQWAVIGMIGVEQVLTSVAAILAGIVIGGLASDLFVPLLAIAQSATMQVPPFRVTAAASDYLRLYAVVAVMLVIGFTVLGVRVARLGVTRAIKLGEE